MTSSHTAPAPCHWFSQLASLVDPRSAPRLAQLFLGALLARGRRTVTRWIRAVRLGRDSKPCCTTVAAAGKRADLVAARLANAVVKPLVATDSRLILPLDDTPTPRYGPHVQGAGVHHNPTPGPAGEFRTKLEFAVELVQWALAWLSHWGKPLWVVADGAYTKAAFLKPMKSLGVTVVATWRPAGGAIRVVLVDEPTGWVAFFCSDPTARVADVGAFHICLWTFVMTAAWAWNRDESKLVGHRVASPWDDEPRHPSHADKRRAWTRELLGREIRAALRAGASNTEIAATAERLLNLAA